MVLKWFKSNFFTEKFEKVRVFEKKMLINFFNPLKTNKNLKKGDTCSWKGQLERTRSWKISVQVGKSLAKLEKTSI